MANIELILCRAAKSPNFKFKNFYISEQYVSFRFRKLNLTSITRWKRTTTKQKFIPKE